MTSDEFARLERCGVLASAIAACEAEDAAAVMVAALEDLAAGPPDLDLWTDLRARAEEWAEFAHPAEMEAYAAVILRRIARTPFGLPARKRLLVNLWGSLGPEDRRAFLARVDGDGRFHGRAA